MSATTRNTHEASARTTRPALSDWKRRSLMVLAGIGLSAGLAACGHGMAAERPDGTPGAAGAGPACMDGGGMGGMHHMRGMGHRGEPMSAAEMQQRQERMVERVSTQLSLDATQKANFVKLMDTMRAQRQAMMGGEPGAMHEQMQSLIKGDHFDAAKANELAKQRSAAMSQGAPEVISAMATFFDSLKPEQQAKVRDFMAKRGMHGGHGGHGGPGMGMGMGMPG